MTIIRTTEAAPCSDDWEEILNDNEEEIEASTAFHLLRPFTDDELHILGELQRCIACAAYYEERGLILIVDGPLEPIIRAWLSNLSGTIFN